MGAHLNLITCHPHSRNSWTRTNKRLRNWMDFNLINMQPWGQLLIFLPNRAVSILSMSCFYFWLIQTLSKSPIPLVVVPTAMSHFNVPRALKSILRFIEWVFTSLMNEYGNIACLKDSSFNGTFVDEKHLIGRMVPILRLMNNRYHSLIKQRLKSNGIITLYFTISFKTASLISLKMIAYVFSARATHLHKVDTRSLLCL